MPQIFSNKRQASRPLQKTQTEHKALMQAKMYLVKVRVSEVTESKLHTEDLGTLVKSLSTALLTTEL